MITFFLSPCYSHEHVFVKYKDGNSSVLHCVSFLLLVYKSVIYCKIYCKDLDLISAMYGFPLSNSSEANSFIYDTYTMQR